MAHGTLFFTNANAARAFLGGKKEKSPAHGRGSRLRQGNSTIATMMASPTTTAAPAR
jgi:hypothetical protein